MAALLPRAPRFGSLYDDPHPASLELPPVVVVLLTSSDLDTEINDYSAMIESDPHMEYVPQIYRRLLNPRNPAQLSEPAAHCPDPSDDHDVCQSLQGTGAADFCSTVVFGGSSTTPAAIEPWSCSVCLVSFAQSGSMSRWSTRPAVGSIGNYVVC